MALLSPFFVLFFINSVESALAVIRPRGVSLSMKTFYNPAKNFSCLDGLGIVPFKFVNDDYCDCSDGSDEPGTAACDNGIFSCENWGFIPEDIPSTRVNDGICDCCDASDEYSSSAECLNTCKELGQLSKDILRRQLDAFLKGNKLRQEYIALAQEKKNELEAKLEELKRKEEDINTSLKEKQSQKKEVDFQERMARRKYMRQQEALAKKREKEKQKQLEQQMLEEASARMAFVELDRNGDRLLTLKELQTFPAFDYDYDGIVSEKEAKFFLQMKEEISLEDFLASGWKVLKHAYFMAKESPEEADIDEIELPTNVKKWDIKQKEPSELPLPGKQKETLDKKAVKTISENAEQARQQLKNASQNLQKIKVQIREIERDLNTDFGLEDEFFILKGQCFDFNKNEYSYKLCPFQYIKQLSSEGFDVLLGLWGSWLGSDESKFSRLRYENGTKCWRGMNHISFVEHHCGAVNEVLWVSEANPCEYHFDFATPAMCATLPSHALEILGEINLGL